MFRCLLGVLATLVAVQRDVLGASVNVTQRRMGTDRISRVVIERLPSTRRSPSLWPHYGPLSGLESMFPFGKRTYLDDGILAEENYVFNTLALPPNSPMPTVNGMHLQFPQTDLESFGDFGAQRMPLMETAASGQHAFVIDDWTRTPVASQLNPTWVGKMAVDNSLMEEFMGRLHRGEVDLNNLRPIDPKLFSESNDLPVQTKIPVHNSNHNSNHRHHTHHHHHHRHNQHHQNHHPNNNQHQYQHHPQLNNNQHHHAHQPHLNHMNNNNREPHPGALRSAASLMMPEIWPSNDALRFENFIGHDLPLDLFSKHEFGGNPIHGPHPLPTGPHMKPIFYHDVVRQPHHTQHPHPAPMRGQENFHQVHRPHYTINQSVIPTPPSESTPQSKTSSDRSQQAPKEHKEHSSSKKKQQQLASASNVVKKSTPGIFTYKLLAAAEKRVRSTASTVASMTTTTPEPSEEKSEKEP